MNDELILVDIFDTPIGSGEKMVVHNNGLLHRAFSVFIYHGDKILLQKRNQHKYHSGGLLTNACCSHPRVGEKLTAAVSRRLEEELGIRCDSQELFHFVYRAEFENGVTEYEYDHVFAADYCGSLLPNPDEIEYVKWISFQALGKAIADTPNLFTPWFIISAPKVLEILSSRL